MSGHAAHEAAELFAAVVLLGVASLLMLRAWSVHSAAAAAGVLPAHVRRTNRLVIVGTGVALLVLAGVLLVNYAGGLDAGAASPSGGAHAGHR